MANYIATLQQKNAEQAKELEALRLQLEQTGKIAPIQKDEGVSDYRDQVITIVYGPNRQNYQESRMTVQQAFDTLVEFYNNFENSTNRNIPKVWANSVTGDGQNVNNATVYAKLTNRDRTTKKMVTIIRDMPLWLAVDNIVQQGKEGELISESEFLSWYDEYKKNDLLTDRKYQTMLQQKNLEIAVEAEINRRAKEKNGTHSE